MSACSYASEPSYYALAEASESTTYVTSYTTITSCPTIVTNCPGRTSSTSGSYPTAPPVGCSGSVETRWTTVTKTTVCTYAEAPRSDFVQQHLGLIAKGAILVLDCKFLEKNTIDFPRSHGLRPWTSFFYLYADLPLNRLFRRLSRQQSPVIVPRLPPKSAQ